MSALVIVWGFLIVLLVTDWLVTIYLWHKRH